MRRPHAAIVLLVIVSAIDAAPVPNVPRDPTKDHDGNKLPKGATARLGSLAFRGSGIWGATFSADGKRLTTVYQGERLTWDAETGRLVERKSYAPNVIDHSAFLVGDRIFWITSGFHEPPNVFVADLRDGKHVSRFVPENEGNWIDGFQRIEVSPDARYFAVVVRKEGVVAVVDVKTAKVVHSHKIAKPRDTTLYITPDSKTLYVAEEGQSLRRYALTTGKELPKLAETEKDLCELRVSPGGKLAVTSGFIYEHSTAKSTSILTWPDKSLTVRSADTGKALGRLELGRQYSEMLFVGSDAILVLSFEYVRGPRPQYFLTRWNLATLKREWEMPCPKQDYLMVSPDGRRLAIAGGYSILLYDAKTGKRINPVAGHDVEVVWVGISSDGKTITTVGEPADRHVATWSETGERKSHTELPELLHGRIAGHPANDHLVWMTYGENKAELPGWLVDTEVKEVVGWDREKGAVAWRFKPEANPREVFTHDGKRVVTLCWNKPQERWDAIVYDGPTGKRLAKWAVPFIPEKGPGTSKDDRPALTLSGDGKLLFVATENVVGVDILTGQVKVRLDTGRLDRNDFMASSPDGSRLAINRDNQQARDLQIIDVKLDTEVVKHKIESHARRCKFSADGKRVAVWSWNETTVTIYDAESDAKPLVLDGGLSSPTAVTFHPNGKSVVVGYEDGTTLVWDLTAK
jgi:WD40 repeat protein